MALQIIFIVISAFTLISAWIVVTNRNLFYAALAMMASFLGVAGLYVLLDAGILAVAQLLVYIGAISILVIFAIMMTRRLMQTVESPFNAQWVGSLVASLISFAIIFVVLWQWRSVPNSQLLAGPPNVPEATLRGSVEVLGAALVSPDAYVIPFELASVLLLAALVGAIFIARPDVDRTLPEEEREEALERAEMDVDEGEVTAGDDPVTIAEYLEAEEMGDREVSAE